MDGMGYCIWRLQAFANLKSSFDGCICGPHTFHVAIKVDILNISSFQSVEKRESIQIGRSCLNNIFEQHQFGHFLLPQKMGHPFRTFPPKTRDFLQGGPPNNSEIIRVPISTPMQPPIRWFGRFLPRPGSPRFGTCDVDMKSSICLPPTRWTWSPIPRHWHCWKIMGGLANKPIPNNVDLGEPRGWLWNINWGLYLTTQLYWHILFLYLNLADVDLYFLCTKHKV